MANELPPGSMPPPATGGTPPGVNPPPPGPGTPPGGPGTVIVGPGPPPPTANTPPATATDVNAAANNVVEGAAVNTLVGVTVRSTDAEGQTITYTLASDSSGGGFKIDAATGVVTVADPAKINFETAAGHAYTITVNSFDGFSTSSQSFSINVSDIAPSTPVDGNAGANTVAEGAAANTLVGITASSTDINGPGVTYSLSNSANGAFKIDAATGVVSVADPTKIDFESTATLNITAVASDGTLSSSQNFTINVTDVALATPVDGNAAANSVAEGAANGSTVGLTAFAVDPNGPATTYSLIGDTSGGGFTIDATTGIVTVADGAKIDFETAAGHAYFVVVQASNGALNMAQTFMIGVTDVAPASPTDSDAAANSVLEGVANGTVVGITAASSDINGGAVTYSLTGDTSGGGFTIDAATGIVTVADSSRIDFETAPGNVYTVTAQASDGTLASSQTFTIGVTNIAPSIPVDTNAGANSVIEGAANGSTVGITASSTDINGPGVVYSLADSASGRFTIDAATGVVTVANSSAIDFESAPGNSYTIVARATDSGGLFSQQSYTIAVTDAAPSTPVDGNAAANTVAEGAANGSTVGVTASSTDINGPGVTYSLVGDTSGGGFAVNAATGVVTVADATRIDFETSGASYTVVVQASDGTLASSQAFVISVSDIAPSTPVDSNAAANQVAVGAAAGATVGVTASSTDVNGPAVTYSLVNDTSNGGFTVNAATGIVTVADPSKILLADPSYDITVDSSDGTLHSQQTFTVNVVVDIAPTVAAGDTLNYTENATSVVDPTITITDPDNATMTGARVAISGGFDNTQDVLNFTPVGAITGTYDPVTGVLTLTGTDTQANYELALESVTYQNTSDNPTTVQRTLSYIVNDGTLDSAAATATINVASVNDAPVVTPTGGSTAYTENAAAAVIDGALTVTDPDSSIASAQVRVSVGFQSGDQLNFTDQNGITGIYNSGTGVLALSGTATVAEYQAALRSITFNSTSDDPGVSKTIEFKVNDALVDSNLATKTLAITSVNDEPTLTATANGGGAVTFTETSLPNFPGSGPVDLFSAPSTSTVEAGQTLTQVVLTVSNVADTTEYLTIGGTLVDLVNGNSEAVTVGGAAGTATVSVAGGLATITVTPTATFTAANVNAMVDSLAYSNDDNTPTATTHTISVSSITDSGSNVNPNDNTSSPAVTTVVTVVATNDGPVAVNDTFTGVNAAITNTALVVDGPSAGTADPFGVQKVITGNILANDSDADGGPLTVVAGTITTAQGGTVTLDADGGFVYVPLPNTDGTVDASDSFTYTVTDGNAAGQNGTATATVTINFVPNSTIWYVDASYAGANGPSDGSSLRPFTDFSQLNGAGGAGDVDSAGDTIFVYDGTYTGNLELEASQKLYGERHGLDAPDGGGGAGTTTLLASNAGAGLTQINGTITASSDNSIQAISWGSSAGVSLTGTNVGNLHVNDANAASAGSINNTTASAVNINGSTAGMNMQFTSVSSGAGAIGITLANANGTFNAAGGTLSGHSASEISISGGAANIRYGGTIGDGTGLSASIVGKTGGTVTVSGNITDGADTGGGIGISGNANTTVNFTGATKTLNTGAGDGVSMTGNTGTSNVNFTGGGLDIDTTNGSAFQATVAGTYSVTGAGNTINTTGNGAALNLSNVTVGAGGITFDSTSSTNSVGTAVAIAGVTGGAIALGTGSISGSDGDAFRVGDGVGTANAGGTSAITYAGSISKTDGTGQAVDIQDRAAGAGNITLSGNITHNLAANTGILLDDNAAGTITFSGSSKAITSTTATAVNLTDNAGATIAFTNGGLVINTTAGNGFNATGPGAAATSGGTVTVEGSGNTITSTTGIALNVVHTTIGANDLTFQSVAANGAASGIVLNNTGTSGNLNVTGTGTTDGTGGTIQNTTGHAISLTNTQDVTLRNMNITGADGNGINGNTINGLVLSNLNISGSGDSTAGNGEGNIYLFELTGNASHATTFDDLNVTNSYVHNVFIENTGGTLTELVVTDSTFSNNGASTVAGSEFVINLATGGVAGTPTATVHATHNTFSGNLSSPATFTATGFQGSSNDGTLNVHLGDGTAGGLNTFDTNNSGITLSSALAGNLNFDVNNNLVTHNRAVGIAVNHFGTGTVTGFLRNNTVGTQGEAGSGAQIGNGLDLHDEAASGTMTLSVTNNIIQSVGGGGLGFEGITAQVGVGAQNSASTFNLTLTGNTIRDIIDDRGLFVNNFNTAGLSVINANISGNTFSNANASGANTTARVGGAPGGSDHVNVTQANAAALAAANGLTASGAPGNTMRVDTNVFFSQPAPPSPPPTPQMALNGQGPGSSDVLTMDALAPLLAVAIAHWAAAGASAAQIEQMQNAQIRIADLPNSGFLANSDEHGITIDSNGAGWGWFVDPTPANNSEFDTATAPNQLTATSGSAAGRIDLLTVIEHELGHVIGLEHSDIAGLMNVVLDTGERRLPDTIDVALAPTTTLTPTISLGPVTPTASTGAVANPGNDTIDAGTGGGFLFGGAGADNFVFAHVDVHAATAPPVTHVGDYSYAEGDRFDFSALTSQFHATGFSDGMIVRAVEDGSGQFATLQVNATDPFGPPAAPHWVSVAQIDGAHSGDALNVLIDSHSGVHLAQIHVSLLV
ncbi:Ig-like domain-containing protein [Bradyrhizobium sp. JYMT SZCCT0180]|uniref:Ig-like domain-containing protein n=1 Tax=Bradyrhizobium sp. JYMT SZCCT0180 TaxID=2807666 RepID=UPI001BA9C66B|nr:Ig-like domain-containing protein [Bradyrhizobium sp. JYMT SZCCT0180]MBR1215629.1 cadherin-like domain-containing protein [Bradyrhizobium sp. JYMT SZCCT0180]